jgi:hypothetical protein
MVEVPLERPQRDFDTLYNPHSIEAGEIVSLLDVPITT